MPSATTKQSPINLLPEKGFAKTTQGRVLIWLLSTFRVIVIATEAIVVAVFLSKFYFDTKNNDLSEEMRQKRAILEAAQEFEADFKDAQKRIASYEYITAPQIKYSSLFRDAAKSRPNDVIFTSIHLSGDSARLIGVSTTEQSIQQLMINLKATGYFGQIALQKIESSDEFEGAMEFELSADMQDKIEVFTEN